LKAALGKFFARPFTKCLHVTNVLHAARDAAC
jgi:hypothetical protein